MTEQMEEDLALFGLLFIIYLSIGFVALFCYLISFI